MTPITPLSAPPGPDRALRLAATRLETAFLAEMLKAAGLGKPRESMGGGVGEEQFASFLREAQAEAISRRGGIGMAESLFNALKEAPDVHR